MARLLNFANYLGQANNVQVIEMFPSTQKTFTYNFNANVSAYTFSSDMQTIVIDSLTYDRASGEPVFSDSTVVGYFANTSIDANVYVDTTGAVSGLIDFTIPSDRYTGPLTPDARTNVAITVASFRWTNTGVTPAVTDSHRWAIIERYEPDVSPGNPRLSNAFVALGVGAISSFTTDGGADASRTAGTYNNITGVPNAAKETGTDASFQVVVASGGTPTFNITGRGTGYTVGDTIKILDSSLGGGGGALITVTVTGIA